MQKETNKSHYIKICEEHYVPIFSQHWWLDAVCGAENWDVAVVFKNNLVAATLPFYKKKKAKIFKIITMPKFTPMFQPYINYEKNTRGSKKIGIEISVLDELIKQLPKVDYYLQQFHYSVTNWLPFMWQGFKQTTYYSYVIEDISNTITVFENFDADKRNKIRKAEKTLKLSTEISLQEFYDFHSNMLTKKEKNISYSFDLLKKIVDACEKNNAIQFFKAVDDINNTHAAICIVYDAECAYPLIAAVNPTYATSNGLAFLFNESIKYFSTKVKQFDFEGSTIKGVEKSYRSYGGTQKPYFVIRKNFSPLLKIMQLFNSNL